jgi:hypothetical protein
LSTATTGPDRKARFIAFYLPQFHPIPENDAWWGKGFTEWVSLAQARPLFRGHYQPHVPADLGFYDLRMPEVRLAQAEMAKAYGIEGFCYWHYWFSGRRLLEMPFNEVLRSGEPDFPFCLAWANHKWLGKWYAGRKELFNQVLVEQTYGGREEAERHFYVLLEAFRDQRYITVDGRPLLYIYRPNGIPEIKRLADHWRELAHKAGLKGLHLVGQSLSPKQATTAGLDAGCHMFWPHAYRNAALMKFPINVAQFMKVRELVRKPMVYEYGRLLPLLLKDQPLEGNDYPTLIPNWDNTPRAAHEGLVFHNTAPELFRLHVRQALGKVAHKPSQSRLIFIRSWNEWSEGNHLEPDRRYGRAFLEAIRDEGGS